VVVVVVVVAIGVVPLIKPTEMVILVQNSLSCLYFLSVGVGISIHVQGTGYSDFHSRPGHWLFWFPFTSRTLAILISIHAQDTGYSDFHSRPGHWLFWFPFTSRTLAILISIHVQDTGYSDFHSRPGHWLFWFPQFLQTNEAMVTLQLLSYTFFLSYYSLIFLPQIRRETIAYKLKETSVIYLKSIQIIVQI
jgi:hypothetical protein